MTLDPNLVVRVPDVPVTGNPRVEFTLQKAHITDLPSWKKYTPKVSKCGLGQKQGVQGTYKGIQFDSYWEFAFYLWCVEIQNYSCFRNVTESFSYIDAEGKRARFFPDFKVNGKYCEVKGIYRPNDLLKRDATIGLVDFYGPNEIKPILREVNKKIPNWREMYHEDTHHTKLGKY